MIKLKLRPVGTSVGVVLPKDVLARMKLGAGEFVFLTETKDGYQLSPYDPTVEDQVELGRTFMKEYRETFRALAK